MRLTEQIAAMPMQLCAASCLTRPPGEACPGPCCLVLEARAGNRLAQEILFAAIARIVQRQAAALCHHRDEAEDLAQTALLHIFQRFAQLRRPERLRPWVKTIVLNSHRMAGRRLRASPSCTEPVTENTCSQSPELSGGLDARRLLEAVLRGIQALSPSLRHAFELRVVQGKSTLEAARALNVTPETVRTRLARARRALRRSIEEASA
jgi:RNA polymerase sigma-70 factor (ECF subfamily)